MTDQTRELVQRAREALAWVADRAEFRHGDRAKVGSEWAKVRAALDRLEEMEDCLARNCDVVGMEIRDREVLAKTEGGGPDE